MSKFKARKTKNKVSAVDQNKEEQSSASAESGLAYNAVPIQYKSIYAGEEGPVPQEEKRNSIGFSVGDKNGIDTGITASTIQKSAGLQLKSTKHDNQGSRFAPPILQFKPFTDTEGNALRKSQWDSEMAGKGQDSSMGRQLPSQFEQIGADVKQTSVANQLPAAVQAKMEGAMGADFSNIQISKDSERAQGFGARAYAQGNEVHFAPGQYDPVSTVGQELIGHELAHVMQQRSGRVMPTEEQGGLPINRDHTLEAEADQLGQHAAQYKGSKGTVSSASGASRAAVVQCSLFGDEDHKVKTNTGFEINNPTFDPTKMKTGLRNSTFAGADDERLANAMKVLYGNPSEAELTAALEEVVAVRKSQNKSLTLASAREQYLKAKSIREAGEKNAARKAKEKGEKYTPVSPDIPKEDMEPGGRHEKFTGSLAQLRFGSVLGDVFGLDPVFGALISPTGGAVGPGAESISNADPNNPTVLHGTVHDAAGYLLNAHDAGPGYNYLNKSWELDTTNPLSGQTSGTAYWAGRNPITHAIATLGTAGGNALKGINPLNPIPGIINAVKNYEHNAITSAVEVGEGNWATRGVDKATALPGAAYNGAKNVASGLYGGAKGLAGAAYGTAKGAASGAWNSGKGLAGAAYGGLKGALGAAFDKSKGLAGAAYGGAKGAATGAWDTTKGLAGGAYSGARDMAGGATREASGMAGDAYDKLKGASTEAYDGASGMSKEILDQILGWI